MRPDHQHQSRATTADRPKQIPHDGWDYLLFLPSIWIAAALGISLRTIGPGFVLVPITSCFVYAIVRRARPPVLLSCYVAYCLFIALASALRLMPVSWQLYFMPEAVVRQLVPTVAFLAVAWASVAYFSRHHTYQHLCSRSALILFLCLAVAPATMLTQGLRYQGDGAEHSALALYGALINNILIAMLFLTAHLYLGGNARRWLSLMAILGIAVTTPFLQFKILAAAIMAMLIGFAGRLVAAALVAAFFIVYTAELDNIPRVMEISSDSGIRLQFISDALRSLGDTFGIGIGYGTESVRWVYRFPNLPAFAFLPDASSMTSDRLLEALSTGVHNSFIQALLRTGVVGFCLLGAAFLAAFPRASASRNVRNHACAAFSLIFLACFVNPALESPVQVVGIGFIYGYLVALRQSVTRQQASPTPISDGVLPNGRIPVISRTPKPA